MGVFTPLNRAIDFTSKLFEKRSGSPFYSYNSTEAFAESIRIFLGQNPDSDVTITPKSAMRISTAYICTLVGAESLASLPAHVCQYTSKGSQKAYNHPAHYLIHDRPNPFQTASDLWKMVSAQIDNEGEAIGVITWDGRWRPVAINLAVEPSQVEIKIVKGLPLYDFSKIKSDIIESRVYHHWEILHFKHLSLDGIRGCSRVRYNAETLGYNAKLKAYGKKQIGTKPPGYFSSDAPFELIKTQTPEVGKNWKDNIDKGMVPFLPLGLKYHHLMVKPDDAQYLDAINATKEDIYGIYRIPPTLAQNYERATFSNAEQQDTVFIKYTMLPRITAIEQELNAKLFAESNKTSQEPYYVKFNVSAFMRGDFKSTVEGFVRLHNAGLINGDTVADLMEWNRWEGGDRRYIQMNMMPTDRVDDVIDSMIAGDTEADTSEPKEGEQEPRKRRSMTISDLIKLNGYDHASQESDGGKMIFNYGK
ncbi:MAG TPA: phage portal protein [Chryseosolibacter sp.]|nr:phage portal protein [Chryseosolibacter sp.]